MIPPSQTTPSQTTRPLRVLLVDPNANTPPYDRALGRALAAAGCRVELLTSRFLYEDLDRPPELVLTERFFQVQSTSVRSTLVCSESVSAPRLPSA